MHTRVHAHTTHMHGTAVGRAPICMALGTFVDPLLGVPPIPADDVITVLPRGTGPQRPRANRV